MTTLVVANQGQPKTTGCPGLEIFGEIITKSIRYSQEATVTIVF